MKKLASLFVIVSVVCILLFSCGGGGGAGDNDYTVTYKANGAESGKAPAGQTSIKSSAVSLQANTGNLAKNGYLSSTAGIPSPTAPEQILLQEHPIKART